MNNNFSLGPGVTMEQMEKMEHVRTAGGSATGNNENKNESPTADAASDTANVTDAQDNETTSKAKTKVDVLFCFYLGRLIEGIWVKQDKKSTFC